MSDTSFSTISRKFKLIDVIDDEWILDKLSDDGLWVDSSCHRLYALMMMLL